MHGFEPATFSLLVSEILFPRHASASIGSYASATGEGGISKFHKQPGGDIVWNVGTAYFGCRKPDGTFCPDTFAKNATLPQVKMIEIKLSQGLMSGLARAMHQFCLSEYLILKFRVCEGAKPAHGGMLPGSKVTAEIAEARGIKVRGLR